MAALQPGRAANHVLVGRTDVLHQLAQLRTTVGGGGLAVLVLEGEAGIGKTALAEVAQRGAAEQGWATVWVQVFRQTPRLRTAGFWSW